MLLYVYHMATEEGNIIRLKKSTLHSVSILIKKSTYQDYEPREKDLYLRDTELKGFYIRIRPNGNRTYNVGARLNGIGKRIYITIGDCDLFTAQEARELARELLVKIKTGINPIPLSNDSKPKVSLNCPIEGSIPGR